MFFIFQTFVIAFEFDGKSLSLSNSFHHSYYILTECLRLATKNKTRSIKIIIKDMS